MPQLPKSMYDVVFILKTKRESLNFGNPELFYNKLLRSADQSSFTRNQFHQIHAFRKVLHIDWNAVDPDPQIQFSFDYLLASSINYS